MILTIVLGCMAAIQFAILLEMHFGKKKNPDDELRITNWDDIDKDTRMKVYKYLDSKDCSYL